jgi:hypothetical protein
MDDLDVAADVATAAAGSRRAGPRSLADPVRSTFGMQAAPSASGLTSCRACCFDGVADLPRLSWKTLHRPAGALECDARDSGHRRSRRDVAGNRNVAGAGVLRRYVQPRWRARPS